MKISEISKNPRKLNNLQKAESPEIEIAEIEPAGVEREV